MSDKNMSDKIKVEITQSRALKKNQELNEVNFSEVIDLSDCRLFVEGDRQTRYDRRRYGSTSKSGQLTNLEKAILESFKTKLQVQDKYEIISQVRMRGGSWIYLPSEVLTTVIGKSQSFPLPVKSDDKENAKSTSRIPALPEDRGPVSEVAPNGQLTGWGMIDKNGPGTKIKTSTHRDGEKKETSIDISKESLDIPKLLQNPKIYKRYMGRLFTERELVYFEAKKKGNNWISTTVKKASWRKPVKCDEARYFGFVKK